LDLGLGKNKKNTFQIFTCPASKTTCQGTRTSGNVDLYAKLHIRIGTEFGTLQIRRHIRSVEICQDNECRQYLTYTKHLFYLQSNKYYVYFNFWIQQKERYITVSISHNIKHNIQCELSGLQIKFIQHE